MKILDYILEAILEFFKKISIFFTSKRYSSERYMILFFLIISFLTIFFTVNMIFSKAISVRNDYESRSLKVENFSIISNKRFMVNDSILANVSIIVKTNFPTQLMLIFDNINLNSQKIEFYEEFKENHEINIIFSDEDFLKKIEISGKVTDRAQKDTKLSKISVVPGEMKFRIGVN